MHGDVKCENVLIFEREIDFKPEDAHGEDSRRSSLCYANSIIRGLKTELYCKLTDFGASQSFIGKVWVGGSQPWQAPECLKPEYLELELAKRTDIYSFGMLLWRVFLDGDPFNLLGEIEGQNLKEKRQRRNDLITEIKVKDELVQHTCDSLALSDNLSGFQLELLCNVIKITLVKDSRRRELDLTRIIKLLTPNKWYQARYPITPKRLEGDAKYPLLDLEMWYSELENASPVVHHAVTSGFQLYAKRLSDQKIKSYDEIRTATAAAYQLATCQANSFGVSFQPENCLNWLLLAAEHKFQQASDALPNVSRAFHTLSGASEDDAKEATKKSAIISELCAQGALRENTAMEPLTTDYEAVAEILLNNPKIVSSTSTLLNASANCTYDNLESLPAASAALTVSEDGVSPIHFLSFWSLEKAKALGSRLIQAGADINASAKHSALTKGTPLMWSVRRDCLEHSSILLALGADPTILTDDGDDSLSYAARLHRSSHLQMLLENIPLVKTRGCICRLIEAAASSQSHFARMKMHGENWQSEATKTLQLLQRWHALMHDSTDFKSLVLQALHGSLKAKHGRRNSDVQISFIRETSIHQLDLRNLLRESVLTFNLELFKSLLDYGVPINNCLDKHKKSLLHLCAKIPDHVTAAAEFAPRLLARGAELDARDENGSTPWMDAALGRKWYLTDFLFESGANALVTNSEGFNIFGLCIKAVNLGTIKYLLKYCKEGKNVRQESFLVSRDKNISALQLAAAIPQPRAHSMKLEVIGISLFILKNVISDFSQLNFRSSGVLPDATALDIAAALGNVHMVKYLVKRGAHHSPENRASVLAMIDSKRSETTCCLRRRNLERCAFIVENWDRDPMRARERADDWTNMRTIDESFVKSSWEPVRFSYYSRKKVEKAK